MTIRKILALAAVLLAVVPAHTAVAEAGFADVPAGHWAEGKIRYVAVDRDWMRDYGSDEFRPAVRVQRRHLARALVRAFAPTESPDPTLSFSDLPAEDEFFPYANVAVKKGWMTASDGAFRPTGKVPKTDLDRALVRALGLLEEIRGLNRIETADGVRLARPSGFGYRILAHELRLHYNHPTNAEEEELLPGTRVTRADAAFALAGAAQAVGTWRITALARYRSVVVGPMTPKELQAAEHALSFAGYPYVWAGEWHVPTPDDYCCGAQAQGGFDCSGYGWWVLREPGGGWDNTAYRPYRGWALPERSSRYMAKGAAERIRYRDLRPMDVMFFDSDMEAGWEGIDHAGLSLGGGWMIHSASGVDGVSVSWVEDGWYRDRFKWARRVIPGSETT